MTRPKQKVFTITYSYADKLFHMHDIDGNHIGQDTNGRELGRDAWDEGADVVKYNYDLGLDERIPLIPRHEKYKKKS